MSEQPDIIGEILRLEAQLCEMAAERDRFPPESEDFERIDLECVNVDSERQRHIATLSVEELLALEERRAMPSAKPPRPTG